MILTSMLNTDGVVRVVFERILQNVRYQLLQYFDVDLAIELRMRDILCVMYVLH